MFRFTIRELVLVTALVAMGVGWWLDHAHNARTRGEAQQQYDAMMDSLRELQANLQWKIESLVELQKKYDELKGHRPAGE